MGPVGRLRWCGALCVVMWSLLTAAATATWTPPVQVSPPGVDMWSGDPVVAVGPTGAAIVGMRVHGVEDVAGLAFRPAGAQSFGPPVALRPDPDDPSWRMPAVAGVVALPDGSALAFVGADRGQNPNVEHALFAIPISASGHPGRAERISGDGLPGRMRIGVDAAGNVTATWDAGGDQVRYAVRDAGGAWSDPVAVPCDSRDWGLAVAPSGEAYVAAAGNSDPSGRLLLWHRGTPTGALTTVQNGWPLNHQGLSPPRLSTDAQGGFALSWVESAAAPGDQAAHRVSLQPPGGSFGPAVLVPDQLPAGRVPGGATVIGYRSVRDQLDPTWQSAAGTESVLSDGAPAPGPAHDLPEAFLPDQLVGAGDSLIAQATAEDPVTAQKSSISAVRAPDGTWSDPVTVSDTTDAPGGVVVAGAPGHALQTWTAWTPLGWVLRTSSWTPGPDGAPAPAPAPAAEPVAAPNSSTWQGGPERTGAIAGTGLTSRLHPAWSVDLGLVQAYAVQDQGRVFALRGGYDDGRPRVTALDVANGHTLWTTAIPNDALVLAAARGTVVAVSESDVVAIDERDGSIRWHEPHHQVWPTPPLIAGDHVVLTADLQGSDVMSYRLGDGYREWLRFTPSIGATSVADGTVIVAPICNVQLDRLGLAVDSGDVR